MTSNKPVQVINLLTSQWNVYWRIGEID